MFYSFVQKICAAFFAKFGIHMAVFSGGIVGRCFPLCTLTILYQQRGSHRRLGNAHGARDDLVEASCVSFASVQARKLNHYAASPLPTKPSGFAGSPRRASEKRTVGSPGRLHHASQSVWTHNVRPARKTGCRSWGCKQSRPLPRAVRAAKLCPRCSPSPGCELQIRRKKIIATILATTKGKNLNFKRA